MIRQRNPSCLAGSWLLVLLLLTSHANSEPTRRLDIRLDPASRELHGEMLMPLPSGGNFRLHDNLEVTGVTRGDIELSPTQLAPGHYRLPASSDGADTVTISWRGHLPEGDADGQMMSSPAGSLLSRRSGWYPEVENPSPGSLALTIRVPSGQRGVGTGSLVEEHEDTDGITSRYEHPHTRDIAIALGPWHVRERETNGTRLRTLFPADLDEAFADTYLTQTARYLVLFQRRLGPYPFESFSIAASPAPVGLAFPGFTLLGERVIPLPFIPHTSLPHELMHAWWGAGVRVDYASGNWAEALTTYLADYALAEDRGKAEEMRRRWLSDLAALPSDQETPLIGFRGGPDPAGRLIGYQHGALLFHMLRQRIGDDAFDSGLRQLADEWMHRTADWSALIDVFGEAAGEPLEAFVTPWLTRPGRPSLHLEGVRLEACNDDGYWLEGELVQRGAHAPWPLSVPLVVETQTGQVHLTQAMEGERQALGVALTSRPLALEVDPGADLLRHPGAMPSILRQLTLDPATRVMALDEALRPLAHQVLGREADALSPSGDLQSDEAAPLLVVGTTAALEEWRRTHDLPAPPREVESAGKARFWMIPGQRIGLISGDTPEAVARLAAALRHYGQRSYVIQGPGGETRDAGTWEVEQNPLRIEWVK